MKEKSQSDINQRRNKATQCNVPKKDIAKNKFPIVGIGASAGGLAALISLLGNVPENSGLAFVIIQHMDPKREDLLVDILQRTTVMKVVQVTKKMSIQPNCVYIIPPNKYMSIQHRVLHLSDNFSRHTLQPIDFFFQSLAEDQQEKSIGVILSGTGTDGTSGLRAIKEKGGLIFIQDPSSAEFDAMPRSAIETGLADVISTAEGLPSEIISCLENKQLIVKPVEKQEDKAQGSYKNILSMLLLHTGCDFSCYKNNTVSRRIERRMEIHHIEQIADYVHYLQGNPQELDFLFKELLIGVTSFFRDPTEWELLKKKVIPALLANKEPGNMIRAWVSSCASGEEAYSLAIVFKEILEESRLSQEFTIQIFATDLDRDAIDKAREGIYPFTIAEEMSAERLNKYFTKTNRGYQVVNTIRNMVIFAQQNMIKDPPFTKIDILTCRNMLIYLTAELQKKLIPIFHFSLNPGGFLFLGSAETVGNYSNYFKPLERKSRIYQRQHSLLHMDTIEFPTFFATSRTEVNPPRKTDQDIQPLAEKLILQRYAPPTVLVNEQGDILYITGRTGRYLEPAAGKVNWNIFAMAREGLNYKLSKTFYRALRQNEPVTLRNAVVISEGGAQAVDITVNPLQEPEALRGMVMIVFNDVASAKAIEITDINYQIVNSQRQEELAQELMQARQGWQAANIEMQIAQEELKSRNEELQSSNEELQSTNEELTTTKEEIQFLNDELKVVNCELQAKLEDLIQVNNDLNNLLNSTKIATLFLDSSLCVKRFTNQMSVVSKLIPNDIGRPITDIASEVFYPKLTEDVRKVLQTLNTVDKQVKSDSGLWFNACIMPYRTIEDKIDGVVITFIDITEVKELEAKLKKIESSL